MDCVILAAGKGTRMLSDQPKVLHEIAGKSLIEHLLATVDPLKIQNLIVVIGHKGDKVRQSLRDRKVDFVVQDEQKGTAHALQQTKGELKSEKFLVFPGDVPLIETETVEDFLGCSRVDSSYFSLISTHKEQPSGYGRVKRDEQGMVREIVEEKDATPEEKEIEEINSGIYFFRNDERLWNLLATINSSNAQGELYLTDLVSLFYRDGLEVVAKKMEPAEEFLGVNTRHDLARAGQLLNERKIASLMKDGVTILAPDSTIIGPEVQISRDTRIEPFTEIKGRSVIGANTRIGPQAKITNCSIGKNVEVSFSVLESSKIQRGVKVRSAVITGNE